MDSVKKHKKIAILQSNYIPWKGYFDLMRAVDEFIIYDEVQYTKNDWRNRNIIKTINGPVWLSIPVNTSGKFKQRIIDAEITDPKWAIKHWKTISMSYSRANYFKIYKDIFEDLYLRSDDKYLSHINLKFIKVICNILGINTRITNSSDYSLSEGKNEKLVGICLQAGAAEYYSGPAACDYIDSNIFEKNGIKLKFVNYDGYREYNQLFPPFEHKVSIIDLIFNEGAEAAKYMKEL